MADVDLSPIVTFVVPVVQAVAVAAVPVIIAWAAAKFSKKTGIEIDQTMLDRLKSAAATEAGQLVAASATNLKNESITVGDARIATAANKVIGLVPEAAKQLGATPDNVARMVVGEIGKLQAQQTQAPSIQVGSPK